MIEQVEQNMRKKGYVNILVSFLLLFSIAGQVVATEEERDVQSAIIYQILIDRFNNGDPSNDLEVDLSDPSSYHGGDFKGITTRLDYIKEMGFTSILLTPIFNNDQNGYDGYSVENYYEVEEHFGSLDDFKSLVKEAHTRNLKVIIDFVVNNEQEEMVQAGKWWVSETNVDGYKLTNSTDTSIPFMQEFVSEVKSVKENFIFIADKGPEINELESEVNIILDSQYYERIASILSAPDGNLENLHTSVEGNNQDSHVGGYIDNHNTLRFTRRALENEEHPVTRLKLALSYLYLSPGVPIVYYGTEIALDGGETPDNRKLMNFRTDDELVNYLNKLSQTRSNVPALTKGSMELLHSTEDGMTVYKRTYEDDIAIVAINNSTKSQKVSIPIDTNNANQQLRGLLNDDMALTEQDNEYTIILDRESVEVYQLEEKVGVNIPFILIIIIVPLLTFGFFYLNKRRVK